MGAREPDLERGKRARAEGGNDRIVVARGEGSVEIAVIDSGRGMTQTEQRNAFEPGYTTRRRGWGLGLRSRAV